MNKKHMKKRLLIFAAAILMIITTVTVHYKTEVRSEAAGIKTQQETKKKIIGATLASSQASYQYAIGNLLVAEAEKDPDYKLEIQYAEWNVKKQEEQMRDFIRRKVDAIIFCPVNECTSRGKERRNPCDQSEYEGGYCICGIYYNLCRGKYVGRG